MFATITLDFNPQTTLFGTSLRLETLAIAKEVDSGIVTIIGGPHPTFLYDEILSGSDSSVDFVLRGESEATLPELLSAAVAGTAPTVIDTGVVEVNRQNVDEWLQKIKNGEPVG